MKHLTISQINPDNYRYYVDKPDPDFSPEKNYQVISQVVEENDKMQTQLNKKVKNELEDATDILAHFAKYKLDIGGEKQIEEYLGKNWITKIYGERLIKKVRLQESINKINI